MLKDDWTFGANARENSRWSDRLSIENDRDLFAFHGDIEGIPLPDRLVGILVGPGSGTNFGISMALISPELSRSTGPAPDVGLGFTSASEEDA